jgi:hypothetical protein
MALQKLCSAVFLPHFLRKSREIAVEGWYAAPRF